jgi:hypothetical protein
MVYGDLDLRRERFPQIPAVSRSLSLSLNAARDHGDGHVTDGGHQFWQGN